jgi:hypothetical protein
MSMNHNRPFRLRRTVVLGLVVATSIGTTSAAAAASTEQFVLPPGASPLTVQPALPPGAEVEQFALPPGASPSTVQPALPPGGEVEPVATSTGQFARPPGATAEPVAAPTGQPGGVQGAPVQPSPVLDVTGGLNWADAGIGAGIAFGGMLLLGGALALLMVRRSGQRNRLATH